MNGYFEGNRAVEYGIGCRGGAVRPWFIFGQMTVDGTYIDNQSDGRGGVFATNRYVERGFIKCICNIAVTMQCVNVSNGFLPSLALPISCLSQYDLFCSLYKKGTFTIRGQYTNNVARGMGGIYSITNECEGNGQCICIRWTSSPASLFSSSLPYFLFSLVFPQFL